MGSCSALVRRAWFCFRPRLRIRCQYKIRQRLLLEMAIWIKKKMYFVPPKVVVLVPSFKVFSMINNKVPYFLVQMLFKLHHLVCSFFFLPVFVHTWCILWCCDFVLISQSWMHLLWKFILLVLVLCVSLQQVLFLTSTIELSTWCLWNNFL
jgi:hypothetical protein